MEGIDVVQRKITLPEVLAASREDRLMEVFSCGTAAIVSPVGGLKYEGELFSVPTPRYGLAARILEQLTDIYYGMVDHEWAIDIEATSFTESIATISPAIACTAEPVAATGKARM